MNQMITAEAENMYNRWAGKSLTGLCIRTKKYEEKYKMKGGKKLVLGMCSALRCVCFLENDDSRS